MSRAGSSGCDPVVMGCSSGQRPSVVFGSLVTALLKWCPRRGPSGKGPPDALAQHQAGPRRPAAAVAAPGPDAGAPSLAWDTSPGGFHGQVVGATWVADAPDGAP